MIRSTSIPLAALALLLSGCAHRLTTLNVRAADTGKDREFTYEAKKKLFEADTAAGKLLRIWVDARVIRFGDLDREIPAGCHGGFLSRHTENYAGTSGMLHSGGSQALGAGHGAVEHLLVTLCPQTDAPAGWQGWHVMFEQLDKGANLESVPPTAAFAFQRSESGNELIVTTPTSHQKVTLPEIEASIFRRNPELLAFVVMSGIVPPSPTGTYEVAEH